MKTTFFKPSIHGWPFDNSWTYTVKFLDHDMQMGFCGGMCWRALFRFYTATPIPRNTPDPQQGDPLYNEIWDAQKDSLPIDTIWKIYRWQQKPDLSHRLRQHSLGHSTQQEWPKLKSSLDNSKPVTLTLITSSNDGNIDHLKNNHRVVAYAYVEREIYSGEGAPSGASKAVDIAIYDPNYPNDDDVWLTFYLGGDRSNIRLHYNKPGEEVHGFFLDDKDRSFAHPQSTAVWINSCVQTGISSRDRADYDLQFSWRCSFVPYFLIQVDGVNWKYNDASGLAKSQYEPVNMDNKQCPAGVGSMTVKLKLPRAVSKVTARLLDSDDYSHSVDVDVTPAILCYPYVHRRLPEDQSLCICDPDISDADLFIKETSPTEAAIQQLDTSQFRWIIKHGAHKFTRAPDPLTRLTVTVIDETRLGNVKVPVFGNFVEKNLCAPTQTSGFVRITRNRQTQTLPTIAPLSSQAQRIFDGFTDNPADYDNDTTVEFNYRSKDATGLVVSGKTMFYGRSIIFTRTIMETRIPDPAKIARMEAMAMELVEMGLIDTAIVLPPSGRWPPSDGGWPPPDVPTMPSVPPKSPDEGFPPRRRPPRTRPLLLKKLRANEQIVEQITRTLKAIFNVASIWSEIRSEQVQILQLDQKGRSWLSQFERSNNRLLATNTTKEAEQNKYDAIVSDTLAYHAFRQLTKTRNLLDRIRDL